MATPRSGAIADAIAAWLNSPTDWQGNAFTWPDVGFDWTAQRKRVVETELETQSDTLLVEVVPDDLTTAEIWDRGRKVQDYTVWILARRRYLVPAAADDAGVSEQFLDDLAALVEAFGSRIVDLILPGQPAGYTVTCLKAPVTSCDAEYVKTFRTYCGSVGAVMREWRPRGS
jgi:hypothetical protein